VIYLVITYISLQVFDIYIVSIIFLISEVLLTGGLHLDGLGDTFDGIYSYRNKEKILEIMKDSRLGTNALLAIVFLILLKVGFVYSIISMDILYPLLLTPIYGRLAIVFSCYKNKTPRPGGMGDLFIGKVNNKQLFITILYTILIVILAYVLIKISIYEVLFSIVFIPVLYILTRMFTRYITNKIDGISGDILGCWCELSQLIYLIFIYLVYRFI
ncbi:MAG TPA: adenosylcobinamide-GDP ribazoletransferase, partial [Peptostreptococcaceae bacterium]|nr:adenosylcobinamide-GDP ribazoletransferase [Peptostreptococcaceae bacterium]